MDRQKDRFIHQSAFLFYFFMTAGVLIVAAGSLLQHYFALRHPVFIPMHIELEMYWDGGMTPPQEEPIVQSGRVSRQ